jgi:hypothetical protein
MCLWHGEGTHDTKMCSVLKKDKELLNKVRRAAAPPAAGKPQATVAASRWRAWFFGRPGLEEGPTGTWAPRPPERGAAAF